MKRMLILLALAASTASAGPTIPAGDMALRHDIQRLADHGIIKGPTTTWPLAWAPILEDIDDIDETKLSSGVANALARVRDRAAWETRAQQLTWKTKLAVADNPTNIRTFQDTPRGDIDASAGFSWMADWFSIDFNVQGVDSDQDSQDLRADDTMIGVIVGNWSVAASTQQRWWGPGWDGSLILGNNARPIPSVTFDRVFTDAFETKWLSWLGPWDLSMMFGILEHERVVPDAQFWGMRFNFRPIPSLEIGLSRSAQWCGKDRPCDLDTFIDLVLGKDNVGDAGIGDDNEPGNQLAGIYIRWSPSFFGAPVSLYTQFIGEDEAGGFPSRFLGQFGVEWSGYIANRWSTKAFVEYAGTTCQFYESSKRYNCAYNHGIYQTGYRYRERSIGHGADGDAELVSVGSTLVDTEDTQWRGVVRFGELNRGGAPDSSHSLTPTPQDILSIDLAHSRTFSFGTIEIGAGYEELDDEASGETFSDGRFYLQWRSSY